MAQGNPDQPTNAQLKQMMVAENVRFAINEAIKNVKGHVDSRFAQFIQVSIS